MNVENISDTLIDSVFTLILGLWYQASYLTKKRVVLDRYW